VSKAVNCGASSAVIYSLKAIRRMDDPDGVTASIGDGLLLM